MKAFSASSRCVHFALALSSSVYGSGFAVKEQSISGLANSFAGGAASADSAATIFDNPAGMAFLESDQNVSTGLHVLVPGASFTNEGSTTLGVLTAGPDSTSKETALLPNFYYARMLSQRWSAGLGISVPYGLATKYDEGWVGRYLAIESRLETVNINPSFSYRRSEESRWSVGAGLNFMLADAVLSNAVDFGLIYLSRFQSGDIPANEQTLALAQDVQANLGSSKYDGSLRLNGDDIGISWNLGAIYRLSETARLGFHYRAEVPTELEGTADFETGALSSIFAAAFPDQGGKVNLDLPATLSLSWYQDINDKLALMADFTRTWWSSFDALVVKYETASPPTSVIPENWENSNRYSFGASYQLSPKLTGRAGVSYDLSPVPSDELRSPRIPDEDRKWLTLGLSFAPSQCMNWHISYLHVFVNDPRIDNQSHSTGQSLIGTVSVAVDVLSIGADFSF